MTPSEQQVVLFDLGGVLVEVDGVAALQRLLGEEVTAEAIWQRWLLTSSWVNTFESGQCTPEAFAAGMVVEWGLPIATEGFLQDFRSWPRRLWPGVQPMLASLASRCTLACLSNTNELHWPHIRDTLGLGGLLHHYYLSHEIGYLKPHPAAFAYVLHDLGCRPQQVVFLDDNQVNVEAARALGLQAYHTVGLDAVQAVLQALGLWSASS